MTFVLVAGRILEYTLCGDPHGEAILHIHGFGGTALQVAQVHVKHFVEASFVFDRLCAMQPSMCEVYRRLHLHLVAPSIPGFGHSDSHPFGHTRRISEWADTMRQLLAQEKIDNFYIAGTSFGCMHAAAVAAAFPERVMGIALFTPTSPSEFDSEIGAQLAAATAVSICILPG